jgi:hypothetical protein
MVPEAFGVAAMCVVFIDVKASSHPDNYLEPQ